MFQISLEAAAVNPYKGNGHASFTVQCLKWAPTKEAPIQLGSTAGEGVRPSSSEQAAMLSNAIPPINKAIYDEGNAAKELKVLMDERDASWNKSSVTVDDVWFQCRNIISNCRAPAKSR